VTGSQVGLQHWWNSVMKKSIHRLTLNIYNYLGVRIHQQSLPKQRFRLHLPLHEHTNQTMKKPLALRLGLWD